MLLNVDEIKLNFLEHSRGVVGVHRCQIELKGNVLRIWLDSRTIGLAPDEAKRTLSFSKINLIPVHARTHDRVLDDFGVQIVEKLEDLLDSQYEHEAFEGEGEKSTDRRLVTRFAFVVHRDGLAKGVLRDEKVSESHIKII